MRAINGPAHEDGAKCPLASLKRKLDEYFFGEETDVTTAIQFYGYYALMSMVGIVIGTIAVLN